MAISIQTITTIIESGSLIVTKLIEYQQTKNRIKEADLKLVRKEIIPPTPPQAIDYSNLMQIAEDVDRSNGIGYLSEVPVIKTKQVIAKTNEESEGGNEHAQKANAISTGCVPCSLGHFSTAAGLLNEAMRFGNKDGMSVDVIDRVSSAIDEFNALERVDLRPEMTVNLDGNIKKLALRTLNDSRSIRHGLENLSSIEELEALAAKTQESRKVIAREWFEEKLSKSPISAEDKKMVRDTLDKKLQEAEEHENG